MNFAVRKGVQKLYKGAYEKDREKLMNLEFTDIEQPAICTRPSELRLSD